MSEKVQTITDLPPVKARRLSKSFIVTLAATAALAVATVVVKKNLSSSENTTEETGTVVNPSL